MPVTRLRTIWRYLRPILPPVLLCALVALMLREPVEWWLYGQEKFDQEAVKEWVREARAPHSLAELTVIYLDLAEQHRELSRSLKVADRKVLPRVFGRLEQKISEKHQEIHELLKSLATPPTKMYKEQLPLFPIIFRLSVSFDDHWKLAPITWDSELPRHPTQYQELSEQIHERGVFVGVQYHLHAYTQRHAKERQDVTRRLWLSGLGIFFALLALVWVYVTQRRERERQRQRIVADQQLMTAERSRLHEELRRQDAERRQEEAERQALELKSQLFANIGIMAGSYAHNIKNLLVRPNDLLGRCLDEHQVAGEPAHMLREVKQTLGTVTERLQQILHTVRRDPSKSERVRFDLNALVVDMHRTWAELAREKWKLSLELDLGGSADDGPAALWIEGDQSHLQQVIENLLFNSRDATFEMRNYLREQARKAGIRGQGSGVREEAAIGGNGPGERAQEAAAFNLPSESGPVIADKDKRQALIAAAAWRGQVLFRTRKESDRVILEVQDNGIGMTEEVRRRCTETHFSTKRNNALFAGLSAGMGLGLSFVVVILEHHQAKLEVESEPMKGATFRVIFPAAP
jgi:signal transduction histidine kinase